MSILSSLKKLFFGDESKQTNERKVFVLLGPPGSGKGSLSSLCIKNLGWVQLSTGNLCRKHIADRTEIGKQIDFMIKSGKLIPDDLITSMVEDWFERTLRGNTTDIVLDGYPRTVEQAGTFNQFLKRFERVRLIVIRFMISDDRVLERLCARFVCSNKNCQAIYSSNPNSGLTPQRDMLCDLCSSSLIKRQDDEHAIAKDRLAVYHKNEHDLLHFYQEIGQPIITLNASQLPDQVFQEFKQLLHVAP